MRKTIIFLLIIFVMVASIGVVYAVDRDPYTWVPTSGQVSAWDSSAYPNSVFLFMDFSWSSLQRLQGLRADNNETLEMDLVVYNYDNNAYIYNWLNYSSSTPPGTLWDSNQPRAYWDTQDFDDSNERSFTVGSADANLFEPNTFYYWWGYAQKNKNTNSWVKISAQRGYRLPSWVYSTWSVFSEQGVVVIPFSQHKTIPGTVNWTY
jgi:hypothetical protein